MVPVLLLPKGKTPEDMDPDALKNGGTVYHLIGEGGIYLRRKNELYSSTQKVDKLAFLGKIEEFCSFNFKPVPIKILDEMTAFAKAIYDKHTAEAAAVMYYNRDTKEWSWDVPEQETSVNGLSVDYKEPPPPPEGFKLFGSFHSHANASAFQSGTDHADELHFDGVHITVGNLGTTPTYHARLCVSGANWDVKDISQLIDRPEQPDIPVKPEHIAKVKPKTYQHTTHYGNTHRTAAIINNWIKIVMPPPEEKPPETGYLIGLYRQGVDGRVSPLDADPMEYDRLGEKCWWGGEIFVKTGRARGQWKLITKKMRQEIHESWDKLSDGAKEAIDEALSDDELRLCMATLSGQHIMRRIAKKAYQINRRNGFSQDWRDCDDWGGQGKWGNRSSTDDRRVSDKRINEMTDDEFQQACFEEFERRNGLVSGTGKEQED